VDLLIDSCRNNKKPPDNQIRTLYLLRLFQGFGKNLKSFVLNLILVPKLNSFFQPMIKDLWTNSDKGLKEWIYTLLHPELKMKRIDKILFKCDVFVM
jgi:hypothetical protein